MEILRSKKNLLIFLMVVVFASVTFQTKVVMAETTETSSEAVETKVKLELNANYEGGRGMSFEFVEGSEVNLAYIPVYISRDGYTRSTTLYKDAECTVPAETKFVITEDTTLYVKWDKWTKAQMPVINEYLALMEESKSIIARPNAWGDKEAFNEYAIFVDELATKDAKGILSCIADVENLNKLRELRGNLTQLTENIDEGLLYIWGNDIASEKDEYNLSQAYDSEDFEPFLVPYLAEDQENVKGNMIVISGGAFYKRANTNEAYPTAEFYRDNGYNAFVLQYRVTPHTQLDAYLDLQRAVRYIKYNGEELGIAHPDRVSATGFSAGGMTIVGMLENLEPTATPDKFDADYVCDEVDKVDSSIDTALNIYGALDSAVTLTNTENLPEMFIVAGAKDSTLGFEGALNLYKTVANKTRAELHVFADAEHSLGLGVTEKYGDYTAYKQWPELALTFLDITYGYQEAFVK